jgi:hypothetical protein
MATVGMFVELSLEMCESFEATRPDFILILFAFLNVSYSIFNVFAIINSEQTTIHSVPESQTSHNIDCVLGSLCYIRPCSI